MNDTALGTARLLIRGSEFEIRASVRETGGWSATIRERGKEFWGDWPDDEIPYDTAALAIAAAVHSIVDTIGDELGTL